MSLKLQGNANSKAALQGPKAYHCQIWWNLSRKHDEKVEKGRHIMGKSGKEKMPLDN